MNKQTLFLFSEVSCRYASGQGTVFVFSLTSLHSQKINVQASFAVCLGGGQC